MNHRAVVRAAAVLGGLLISSPSPARAAPVTPGPPAAKADVKAVALGGAVHLAGSGWAPSEGLVQLEFCGNLAMNGSVDCDVANTAVSTIEPDGSFSTGMTATAPPSPCPCVVRIGYPSQPGQVLLPIVLEGVAVRPPQAFPQIRRQVTVTALVLEGSGPWWSWFGGAPRRRIVYTIINTGDVDLDNPALTVTFGHGHQPSGYVDAPPIGALNVGQSKTFSAAVPFSAPAFGSYTVSIVVDPIGVVGSAQDNVSVVPWGLIVLSVALLAAAMLWLRAKVNRRRTARKAITAGAGTAPGAAIDPAPGRLEGTGGPGWGSAAYLETVEPIAGPGQPSTSADIEHEWAGPWMPLMRDSPVAIDATSSAP